MKKISLLFVAVLALLFSSTVVKAQYNPYDDGSKLLSIGIGTSSRGIPFQIRFEVPVADNITAGGALSYQSYNQNIIDWSYTIFGIIARGSYHFNELFELDNDQIDIYGGLSLGYFISSYKYDNILGSGDITGSDGNLDLGAHIGGRYYFTEKIGINLELGGVFRYSTGTIGVTFRL